MKTLPRMLLWIARPLCALLLAGGLGARAQDEAAEGGAEPGPKDREMAFLEALLARGWADYAQTAKEQFARTFPGERKLITLLEARVLSAQGKFAEAVALVKGLPADDPVAVAAQINMARNMFARAQKAEASAIFEKVFADYKDKLPADPELLRELGEAGYVQYQIKMDARQFAAAARALDFPIRAMGRQLRKIPDSLDPEDPRVLELEDHNKGVRLNMRLLEAKKGFALVDHARSLAGKKEDQDKAFAAARKLAEKLSFVYDLAFGHAIVMMMQIEQARGNAAGIEDLTKQYRSDLEQMDELIKKSGNSLSESPLAGSRFIKGEVYFERARKATTKDDAVAAIRVAGNEFANVFVKYAGSVWENKAAAKFNELKSFAQEKHGITINLPAARGAAGAMVAESMIRMGTELLGQKKYREAAEQYRRLFAQFPEFKNSGRHYGNMARAYFELGDHRAAMAIAGFLGERLTKDEGSLPALQILAKQYYDLRDQPEGKEQRHLVLYRLIGESFPDSPVAPSSLYLVAETLFSSGKREEGLALFRQIVARYPGDKVSVKAGNRLAFAAYEEKDFAEAAKHFEALAKSLPEGLDRAEAEFRLANCLRSLGKPEESRQLLENLTKVLDPSRKDSPFYVAATKDKSQELLENVWYTLALAQIRTVEGAAPDQAAEAQKAAAATLAKFLESYPKSKRAPDALFQLGKMRIKIGQIDEAVKVFDELSRKYPQSDEGRDALYSLAKAAVEAGKPEVAQESVRKMLGQPGAYRAVQFLKVGRFMMDNRFFVEAENCMKVALAHADTKDRPELEQEGLVNLAESSLAQEKFEQAVTAARDTLKKFPNSGYLFRLLLTEAEALARLKKFDEATTALTVVYEQAHKFKQAASSMRADMVAALIEELRGDPAKSAGAFMRIVMLGDHAKPETATIVREAAFQGIAMARKTQPVNWVAIRQFADFYLEYFPGDEKAPEMRRARAEAITNGAPEK
jgi:TolA-binding protein